MLTHNNNIKRLVRALHNTAEENGFGRVENHDDVSFECFS